MAEIKTLECKPGISCLWSPGEKKPSSEAVAEYLEGRKKYEDLRKQKRKKGSSREEQVSRRITQHFFGGEGGC